MKSSSAALKQNSLWEVTVQYSGQEDIVRRVHTDFLQIGSSPRSQVKLPRPAPDVFLKAERVGADFEVHAPEDSTLEIKVGGKWVKKSHFKGAKIPELRFKDTTFQIREVSHESFHFKPLQWAGEIPAGRRHALWHFRGETLIESVIVESRKQKTRLKCGMELLWNPKRAGELVFRKADGSTHTLELVAGPKDSLKATLGVDTFYLTHLPEEASIVPQVTLPQVVTPSQEISKFTKGLALFWLLFVLLLNVLPKKDANLEKEVNLESLGTDMRSTLVENSKNPGGNGRRGGGGVETVAAKDPRGGAGHTKSAHSDKVPLQAYKAARKSAPLGAKGAVKQAMKQAKSHAAPTASKSAAHSGSASSAKTAKAAKRSSVSAGNEFIGAPRSGLFSAVAKLDAGVKSGRVSGGGGGAVAVGGGTDAVGRDGVLGALGKASGRSGGGGLGLGGVGTKGFGGGGGGGRGAGFGTGIGEGLGEGHGPRQLAFGTGGTVVRGGLEKSEIDAVVQENLSQIRYCYNLAVRADPKLQGKVITAFTIGASGRVVSSRIKSSNMGAPNVDSCISARIASWTFPKPRGGGEVGVTYPFLLKAN